MAEVPRIACRPTVHTCLAGWPDAELGAGGSPERHQAGAVQPGEQLRVAGVAVLAVQPGTHAGRKVDGLATEVLDQERHAGERPIRQAGVDRPPGALGLLIDNSGDLVV